MDSTIWQRIYDIQSKVQKWMNWSQPAQTKAEAGKQVFEQALESRETQATETAKAELPNNPLNSGLEKNSLPEGMGSLLSQAENDTGLPTSLLQSVIRQESGFNPSAVSPKGAEGLMQLMPSTARSLGVENSMDPEQNVNGGSRYLASMLERYDGDVVKALAAYNAGPGNVEKAGGVPDFKETKNYIDKIVRSYLQNQ